MKHSFPAQFVLKNGIHGQGVFTTVSFKKGDTLFKLTGESIESPTRTSVQITKTKHIEDPIASHVNHSCTPTAKVSRGTMSFVSLRDIEVGEEITFDYNKNEDSLANPFVCLCCHKEIRGRKKTTIILT
jgi:SET domain-containing protein